MHATQFTMDPQVISLLVNAGALAARHLDFLLHGRRDDAGRFILSAVETGTSVKFIYREVLQPVQRELGRLWQTNDVSVAQEHYCTAATRLIMGQLYPYLPMASRIGKRVVVTCVGGELHEVGARMVADLFEMEGWDSYFLGTTMSTRSLSGPQECTCVGMPTSRARRVTFASPGNRCSLTKSGVWKMRVPDPPQVRKSGSLPKNLIASR